MPGQKKLFLLDAMALIYRAYFALNKNPRINSKGLNTSAVLGFANTLYDVLKNEKPTHIGVAFDTHAPTVRSEEYVEYKANREAMPEDIATSLPYILKLLDAFNIPVLAMDGYEADDVIGTLAKRAEQEDFRVYMMTPDKDFGQLVSDNILIYKPPRMGNKAEILGVREICTKYNIHHPEQFIDILGLWGDSSDNIPGVPGVGEKTAMKLVHEYGSVEKVLLSTDDFKGKLKENLEEFAQQAITSKHLATIILDVPVEFKPDELEISEPNRKALRELFDELEFRAFAKRVLSDPTLGKKDDQVDASIDLFSQLEEPPQESTMLTIKDVKHKYFLVDDKDKRKDLIKVLGKQKAFAFDTESTGLDTNQAELIGVSFSYKAKEAYFVILPENRNEAIEVLKEFKELFSNPDIEKVGQNLKYDISLLQWYDIEVEGRLFDTMLAHYIIEPDLRHNLNFLAETYLDYSPVPIESLIGKKGRNQLSMRLVDINSLSEYACEDADITWQLKEVFQPMLKETGTLKLFTDIEIPLVKVLARMEKEGVQLDKGALNDYSKELDQDLTQLVRKIYEYSGFEFNIASPKQLGEVLFDHLKITDKPKLTKTKQYATGEDVLSRLINKHDIIQNILDFRSLTKLKTTYVDVLPQLVNPRDNRIHTNYNQAVAATGRLSSNNPNLQNIPIRTEKGREIRKAFVPRDKDHILMAADYSQIELRIIAELSQDEGMMDTFINGQDIHSATAAKVYSLSLKDVDQDMRRTAKMVNFGIVYGISAFGLSERLNIARKEAAEIIRQYFEKYPGVKEYMDKSIQFARENGFVETIMGRRRYLRDINSGNATVRGYAERNAINAPIQGSSADMIKIAMIEIDRVLNEKQMGSKMILQVHDELVFDAKRQEVDALTEIVEEKMKHAIRMKVPIEVEVNTGENWLAAH